jgi:diaminobutyrate acetyltransferase
MPRTTADTSVPSSVDLEDTLVLRRPTLADGAAMWTMARDSRVLDLNASYAYVLWCRDFAATSVIATRDGAPAGFVTGYLRPDAPDTLMVWQVAVDAEHRGRGIAARMLHALVDRLPGVRTLETTITPDNEASISLFTAFARDRGADLSREPVFDSALFPDGHESELLFRIGPLG